jgi:hypothetical protein
MNRRPPKTETGDDPIDAILHRIDDLARDWQSQFEALGVKVEAIPPYVEKLSKGIADEKNIAMIATLNNVRMYLVAIEQLPNVKAEERGPLAREAMKLIDEVVG